MTCLGWQIGIKAKACTANKDFLAWSFQGAEVNMLLYPLSKRGDGFSAFLQLPLSFRFTYIAEGILSFSRQKIFLPLSPANSSKWRQSHY